MQTAQDLMTSTFLGRLTHKAFRPLIHLARQVSHPGIPTDHNQTAANYRGHRFVFEHRRWSQSDALAIQQCFTEAQYDLPSGTHGALIDKTYNDIIASGRQPLILDCGANIGASVAWFSVRYPKAHIVAVEPAPENFALLSRNAAGLDVDLRQAGIAAFDCQGYIDNQSEDHMGFRTNTNHIGTPIHLISIPSILESKPDTAFKPFLLKVDIEGAEKDLFAAHTEVLNRFPLIIFEPHDWLMPGQNTSQEFFRFHVAADREFCMKHENVASIASADTLRQLTQSLISQSSQTQTQPT